MKNVFIRIFALLGFFLASPAFSATGYQLKDFPQDGCYSSRVYICTVLAPVRYSGTNHAPDPGYDLSCSYKATTGVMLGAPLQYCSSPSGTPTPTPTPTITPSPTPTLPPCTQKLGPVEGSGTITRSVSAPINTVPPFILSYSTCYGGCEASYSLEKTHSWSNADGTCNLSYSGTPEGNCVVFAYYSGGHYTGRSCTSDGLPIPGSDNLPLPTQPPNVPTPMPPGTCTGEFNGQPITYNCPPTSHSGDVKESTGSDGTKTTVTTGTSCNDQSCTTTTTTTTTPPGGGSGSTSTTTSQTQTKKSFCEENPQSKICSGSDTSFCQENPNLSVCKDGSWGGGTCGSEPACSGDAVQCAQARYAFKSFCESKRTSDLLQGLNDKLGDDGDAGSGLPSRSQLYQPKYPDGLSGVWTTQMNQLKQTPLATLGSRLLPDIGDGGVNPSFTFDLDFGGVMNMGTHTLEIDPNIWAIIRAIVLVSALIYAYKMIFGG